MEQKKDESVNEVVEEVKVEKTPIEQKLEKLEAEGKIPKSGEEDVKRNERPLTKEQEEVIAKHKAKEEAKQKADLVKKQKAYQMLQQGAYFMKFIYDDIERQKNEHQNRTQRRRFTKELRKGIFSRELVDVYAGKIDVSMEWIEKNLNNPEQITKRITTHYKTLGFKNPEILKALIETYFKVQFQMPKGEATVDGPAFYKDLKDKEARGELPEQKESNE